LLGDEATLLTALLDNREAGFFLNEGVVRFLMARHHHELLRVGPDRLVLLPAKQDELRAALVFALAQIGRWFLVEPKLSRLLLKRFVRVAEGGFVLGRLLD